MSWQVDYTHAEILFSAKHMMISTVRGSFDKFTVNVNFNEAEPIRSHVEVQIEADSLNTKLAQRDEHMKSTYFLDVLNHPFLTFVSKRIEKIGDQHGRIIGDLTIRGVKNEVVLEAQYGGQVKSPWGIRAGFNATTKLDRTKWGLNWN